MTSHTPGPWIIDWNVSRLDIFSACAATLVASIRRSALSEGIDGAARANARLIAAAPDLLEALQMAKHIILKEGTTAQFEQVCSAIEKATGEPA